MSLETFAQNTFQTSKDQENGSVVLKGPISFDDLSKEPNFTWFQQSGAYKADEQQVSFLNKDLASYQIVVVMGTWCEDSQNLIPKLYSVLQRSAYPMDRLSIFGVDRTKDALKGEKARYGIEKVPTIIVYKDDKEVGRIVEVVKKSIEADLADIVAGKQ